MKQFAAFPLASALLHCPTAMIINSTFIGGGTPLQGSQNGDSANAGAAQAGDFSALLFLILGAPPIRATITHNADATALPNFASDATGDHSGTRQSSDFFSPGNPSIFLAVNPLNRESGDGALEDTGAQLQSMETVAVTAAFMQQDSVGAMSETLQNPGDATIAKTLGEGGTAEFRDQSSDTSSSLDTRLQLDVPVQPQAPLQDTAITVSAKLPGDVSRIVATVAQRDWLAPSENPVVAARTIETSAIDGNELERGVFQTEIANGAEAVTPESFSRSGGALFEGAASAPQSEVSNRVGEQAMKWTVGDPGVGQSKGQMAEGTKATQLKPNAIESSDIYAQSQGLVTYTRDVVPGILGVSGKQARPLHDGLELDGSQTQAERVLYGAAPIETAHVSSPKTSANSDQGEHGGFFQQRFHEPSYDSARASFEAMWQDRAPIHSTHTTEITPQVVRAVDWRPVIDHVAGELRGHIRIGKSEAVIQLDPPELGKLRIDLRLEGDRLEARIHAENHESGQLIETHLPELRLALGENRIERLDVQVRVDSGSWGGTRGDGQQGQRQEAGFGRQPAQDGSGASQNNSEERQPSRRQVTPRGSGRVSMWA
jgi:hypothetical protein